MYTLKNFVRLVEEKIKFSKNLSFKFLLENLIDSRKKLILKLELQNFLRILETKRFFLILQCFLNLKENYKIKSKIEKSFKLYKIVEIFEEVILKKKEEFFKILSKEVLVLKNLNFERISGNLFFQNSKKIKIPSKKFLIKN